VRFYFGCRRGATPVHLREPIYGALITSAGRLYINFPRINDRYFAVDTFGVDSQHSNFHVWSLQTGRYLYGTQPLDEVFVDDLEVGVHGGLAWASSETEEGDQKLVTKVDAADQDRPVNIGKVDFRHPSPRLLQIAGDTATWKDRGIDRSYTLVGRPHS
jgi:hypothetical protein